MLTDRGIHSITESGGTEIESFASEVSFFASDASGIALFFADRTVKCYGTDGACLFTRSVSDQVRAISKCGETVFLKTDRRILRYRRSAEYPDETLCVGYDGVMLPYSESCVLLTANGEARYFRFPTE
jgi:hypothetical protein